jgi:predicted nucleic acid-binding Zn ribbon protein
MAMNNRKRLSAKGFQPPRPIGGVLDKALGSLGLKQRYHGWQVVSQWADIVGTEIAKNAEAVGFREGELVVAVPNAGWRHTLSLQLEEILAEIRKLPYGRVVKSIRLQGTTKRT